MYRTYWIIPCLVGTIDYYLHLFASNLRLGKEAYTETCGTILLAGLPHRSWELIKWFQQTQNLLSLWTPWQHMKVYKLSCVQYHLACPQTNLRIFARLLDATQLSNILSQFSPVLRLLQTQNGHRRVRLISGKATVAFDWGCVRKIYTEACYDQTQSSYTPTSLPSVPLWESFT